jgi:chromate transporter
MAVAMMAGSVLVTLALRFALLSLFAIGGANAAIPEMHRLAVDVQHWMSDRQFADMYGISQLSPGPNVIIVTLIGYHVAGLAGALVATAAMTGPTCLFAFWIARIWERFKDAHWRNAIQAGLVPLSIGLMAASAYVITGAADKTWAAAAITAVTALAGYFTRIHPMWFFVVGGAAGLGGLL